VSTVMLFVADLSSLECPPRR